MGWFTASKPATTNKEKEAVKSTRQGDQLRVEQLELQLQELATTAAHAVDRAEGLESELEKLKKERNELQKQKSTSNSNNKDKTKHYASLSQASTSSTASSTCDNSLYTTPSRSSSMTTINTTRSTDVTDMDVTNLRKRIRELQQTNEELNYKLHTEQQLRTDCEARESALSNQIEDLSANLFEEANRKVKQERERCAFFEQKLKRVDTKELEKDQRWHNIETAISAIHKARSTLNSPQLHHYI